MNIRRRRFDDAGAYFVDSGSGWMKLTKEAAQAVVERLQSEGIAISGIEAGIWHDPGFEARIDGILSESERSGQGIKEEEAQRFFHDIDSSYDTFIVTVRRSERNVCH